MFEAHVTLKYTSNRDSLRMIDALGGRFGFKRAKLYKASSYKTSGFEGSTLDIFASAKNESLHKLQVALEGFLAHLVANGLTIERYKIEAVLLDSSVHDYLYMLERKTIPEGSDEE